MLKKNIGIFVATSLLGLFTAIAHVNAAEGDLDRGFGTGGMVRTVIGAPQFEYEQAATAVALASNNDIVIAGYNDIVNTDFLVALYDSNGRLKDSVDIGLGGYQTVDFGNDYDSASGVAVQSDGRIVVVGGATISGVERFGVARFNADLGIDVTFDGDVSGNGKFSTAVGSTSSWAQAVTIQPDGKIVVVGTADNDFAVVRYLPDGKLDTSFSGDGIVKTNLGGTDIAYGAVIQPDGKIVVVGDGNNDFAVVRYLSDGTPDSSFSDDGIITTNIGSSGSTIDTATSVVLQTDNKIVVAGYYGTKPAIVRYESNGSLDSTFDGHVNGNGIVTKSFSSGVDIVANVALQPDGKIVLGGWAETGTGSSPEDFVVARLNPDGTSDVTFSGGQKSADFDGNRDKALGMVIQPNGRIVQVGGFVADGFSNSDIGVVRYIGDETSPTIALTRKGQGTLGVGQSDTISITLSEHSSNLTLSDLVVLNGVLSGFSGSGSSYSVTVAPIDQSLGKITMSISSGSFSDSAGNSNLAGASLEIDFDTLRPVGSGSGGSGSTGGSTSSGSQYGLLKYKTGNKKITFTFPSITNASAFTLTNGAGRTVCNTSSRTCTVKLTRNGVASMYTMSFRDKTGATVTGVDSVSAMAGFTIGITTAKVRKKVTMSKIISTPSKGTKKWNVTSGKCRISGRTLVMPTKSGRCTLKLQVAKRGNYPAMSTIIRLSVTR